MIPVIEEAELREAITPARAVEVIREAFRADGEGRTTVPAVINLDVPHGEFHVKTAHIEGVPHIAVKVASGFYGNITKGLPSGSGLMALFDADTGLPAGAIARQWISDRHPNRSGRRGRSRVSGADLDRDGWRHRIRRPGSPSDPLSSNRPQFRANRGLEPVAAAARDLLR